MIREESNELPIVLAVSGASGAIYARRLLDWFCASGCDTRVVVSAAAEQVMRIELGQTPEEWECSRAIRYRFDDFSAPIASGSFLHRGMVICPCSMGTLAAVANGVTLNLIHRAADVCLKERRRLIVVPRETPLSAVHLENMLKLARAGATVLPAMPSFYPGPETVEQVAETVVGRILDSLGLPNTLVPRWGAGS